MEGVKLVGLKRSEKCGRMEGGKERIEWVEGELEKGKWDDWGNEQVKGTESWRLGAERRRQME